MRTMQDWERESLQKCTTKREWFVVTYKLFKCDEFRHNVSGIIDKFARSSRKISNAMHPSSDGTVLKFLASDKTLNQLHTFTLKSPALPYKAEIENKTI